MSKQGHKLKLQHKKILSKHKHDWHDWKLYEETNEYYLFVTKEECSRDRTYLRIEK